MSEKWIKELVICGVGADADRVNQALAAPTLIIARGEYAANWLKKAGLPGGVIWRLSDSDHQKEISIRLAEQAAELRYAGTHRILYITSVYPASIDLLADQLIAVADHVAVIPGADPLIELKRSDPALTCGRVQTLDGLSILEDLYPFFSPALSSVLYLAGIHLAQTALTESLKQVYPEQTGIWMLGEEIDSWQQKTFGDFIHGREPVTALFIPPLSEDASLESFMQVIARLRAPDGCPWDRKQTHASLRTYLLEETYEALDALDHGDMAGLREELGDLLLQIALHSQIAVETGEFNISQVIQYINRKIISRHPHVFADVKVRNDKDVVQNWEKLKEIERAENGKDHQQGLLDGIPAILPALSQAQSIQDRATRVGFDWPEIKPVIEKVIEEMGEVAAASDGAERAGELGDLLFAVVNLVRWYGVDAESALRKTNLKFRKRFAYIEKEARMSSRDLQKMTLAEMDVLWEAAKAYDD